MNQQASFLSIAHQKKLRCENFLDAMKKAIPWKQFLQEISKHQQEKTTGRKRTDNLILLKVHFLQQWFALSDPAVEEAIYDRNSFQKFLNIDLLSENVPDETTILNFRHFLEKHSLPKKFFQIVNKILEEKSLILKQGTIVDATIITAPSSTKNKDKKRDIEMTSTKKGNKWHFGMKAHIGVDANSGNIHSLETTTARTHDKKEMKKLLHGEEQAVFGDKGYISDQDKKEARKEKIFYGILDKAKRGKKLSLKQKKKNKLLSSIRSKVEHPFQVLKCQWKYEKVRYKGLMKNTMQLFTLFSLINLYRVRHQFA